MLGDYFQRIHITDVDEGWQAKPKFLKSDSSQTGHTECKGSNQVASPEVVSKTEFLLLTDEIKKHLPSS